MPHPWYPSTLIIFVCVYFACIIIHSTLNAESIVRFQSGLVPLWTSIADSTPTVDCLSLSCAFNDVITSLNVLPHIINSTGEMKSKSTSAQFVIEVIASVDLALVSKSQAKEEVLHQGTQSGPTLFSRRSGNWSSGYTKEQSQALSSQMSKSVGMRDSILNRILGLQISLLSINLPSYSVQTWNHHSDFIFCTTIKVFILILWAWTYEHIDS